MAVIFNIKILTYSIICIICSCFIRNNKYHFIIKFITTGYQTISYIVFDTLCLFSGFPLYVGSYINITANRLRNSNWLNKFILNLC